MNKLHMEVLEDTLESKNIGTIIENVNNYCSTYLEMRNNV